MLQASRRKASYFRHTAHNRLNSAVYAQPCLEFVRKSCQIFHQPHRPPKAVRHIRICFVSCQNIPFRRQKQQQLRALQILIFRQKFLRQLHRHRAHSCGIQHMKIILRGCFHHENIHTQKFGIYLPIHSRHTMRKQPLHVLTDFPFIRGHCRRTAFRSFL